MGKCVSLVVIACGALFAACTDYADPEVPELTIPLCKQVASDADPDPERDDDRPEDLLVKQFGYAQPGEEFTELHDGDRCPVFFSWQAMTTPLTPKLFGLDPVNVQILLTWELEEQEIQSQTFTADLVCRVAGEPDPLPMTLMIGPEHGEPVTYADGRPGHVTLQAAGGGGNPADCNETSLEHGCIKMDVAVSYVWADPH